jgi:RimJ/RimL family protein N-acetyltransferase
MWQSSLTSLERRAAMSDSNRIVFRIGKRVYLRPILKGDLAKITVWINDPEVTQFLMASYPQTPEDEEAWFKSLADRRGTEVVMAIVLVENDQIIGTMGLHHINDMHGTATTGSVIGSKEHWGKGYGTEAKMLLLEYAFNTLNLRKINSEVYSTNPRSKRCLEKCGYRTEGTFRKEKYRCGQYVDVIRMSVFKHRFLKIWKKYKAKFLDIKDKK